MRRVERGDAIIIVLGLLSILLAGSLAWLVIVRTGEKVAHYSLHELKAREIAEIGIAEAVYRLERDDRSHDHYGQSWHADFLGTEVFPGGEETPGASWFPVLENGLVVGRWAVVVEDEAGRVNLNEAGNIDDRGRHRVKLGARVREISLEKLPGLPLESARAIVRARSRPFGRPFLSVEDISEIRGIGPVAVDRVRHLASVSGYDLEIDSDLAPRVGLRRAAPAELVAGLRRSGYRDPAEIAVLAANIRDFFDRDGVPTLVVGEDGSRHLGIERTPFLNEVESSPDPRLKIKKGVVTFWIARGHFVEIFNPYPTPARVGGWRVSAGPLEEVVLDPGAEVPARGFYTIGDALALKFVYAPGGKPVIVPVPIREPPGCDQYHPFLAGFSPAGGNLSLYDARGNPVEETVYPALRPGRSTLQKNDPRMRGRQDWFAARATPGAMNASFMPGVGGETCTRNWPGHFVVHDRDPDKVGQLGFVHAGRQWRTINLRGGRPEELRTQDIFTASDDPGGRVPGRLNLNTARAEVLATLPGFGPGEAAAIIAGRPYRHIGEAGPVLDAWSRRAGRWGYSGRDCAGDGYPGADFAREFPYRRISGLVTVRANAFRVTALGQVFRPRPENDTISGEDILAEKRITAVYDRGRTPGSFLRWKVE